MGKFIISDSEEKFCKSGCNCNVCNEYNKVNKDWESFSPKTNLQKRMKDVVSKIEKKYN